MNKRMSVKNQTNRFYLNLFFLLALVSNVINVYSQNNYTYGLFEIINIDTIEDVKSLMIVSSDCELANKYFAKGKFPSSLKELVVMKCQIERFSLNICNIITLSSLTFYSCQIDEIPPSIKKLENLEVLDLSYNPLRSLPDEVFSLSKLNYLNLKGCNLTTLPSAIEKLNNLEVLLLSGNKINNWDFMMKLKDLKEIHLENCNIKLIPKSFQAIRGVKKVYLDSNKGIDVKMLFEFISNNNVEVVSLKNCGLKKMPINLQQMTNLKILHLEGNKFSVKRKRAIKKDLPNCEVLFDFKSESMPNHGL